MESCYEVLGIEENTNAYDIHVAYQMATKTKSTFDAYMMALELCAYKPFFESEIDFFKFTQDRESLKEHDTYK
jgi:hypothetical protein